MRSASNVIRLLALAAIIIVPTMATAGGLDSFLEEIEIRASGDIGGYKTDLGVTFDVSERKIDSLYAVFSKSSDVYMCLRIGEVARVPLDRVVEVYTTHKGQGWGVIAKNLGIKPGSAEFHALKADRLPVKTA
ncbi:MAG: hypothetical protein R3344_12845, partial [Acidobacteriota bacterium]|nr:hypothetical protein [Acidobacteriota bacterium]